jgi:DNA-binding CsgD family transcriptional regulator
VAPASRIRLREIRLLPRALAGRPSEPRVAALSALGVGVIFVIEALTPDAVVSTAALIPLLAACWLLSERWSFDVWLVTAVLFAVAVGLEPAGRVTLMLVAAPTLLTGWVTRLSAAQLADLLSHTQNVPQSESAGSSRDLTVLTRREREVARLAGMAYTAAEIGQRLHIGERTVETHLASTYAKLGITSKAQLIRLASRGDQR